jgi:hypothetical protein
MNRPREPGNAPPIVHLPVGLLYPHLFTGHSKFERIGSHGKIELRRQSREVCGDVMQVEQTFSKDFAVAWIDDMKHHAHCVNDGVLE